MWVQGNVEASSCEPGCGRFHGGTSRYAQVRCTYHARLDGVEGRDALRSGYAGRTTRRPGRETELPEGPTNAARDEKKLPTAAVTFTPRPVPSLLRVLAVLR